MNLIKLKSKETIVGSSHYMQTETKLNISKKERLFDVNKSLYSMSKYDFTRFTVKVYFILLPLAFDELFMN